MAAILWSDVLAHAPDLLPSAGAQSDILAHVNAALNISAFGGEDSPRTKLARIYLAAHQASVMVMAASGVSSAITSKKLGDARIEYADPNISEGMSSNLGSTAWGRLFIQLCRSSVIRSGFLV